MWRDWKARVRIAHILADIGWWPAFRVNGRQATGPCPIHGGDNRRAFHVDRERDLWFCFTRCQTGGDVIDLVWRLVGQSWPRAAAWLERLTLESPLPPATERFRCSSSSAGRSRTFTPFTRRLLLETAHPFFNTLHIRSDTLRRFEAGVWRGRGLLEGTAAIRLHDSTGRPLGYAGRRLDLEAVCRWGKWKWPPGFPKAQHLWNWHRVRPEAGVVVVEGPWSVMKLWQAGYNNVVAICGLHVSEAQAALLRRAPSVTLLLDGDQAGYRAAARNLAAAIHDYIRAIHPPAGKDPADLSEEQLVALLKRI